MVTVAVAAVERRRFAGLRPLGRSRLSLHPRHIHILQRVDGALRSAEAGEGTRDGAVEQPVSDSGLQPLDGP